MPTPKRGPRLGGSPAHQKHLLANLASDLFRHGRLRTTEAKAKALRPYAERLITKGKQGDLHARRDVLGKLRDRDVVAYLFEDVAPRFADRNGGYTRILKLAPRKGDNARMVLIELVEQSSASGEEIIEEAKQGRSRGLSGRRRRRGESAEDAAAGSGALGTAVLDDAGASPGGDDQSSRDAATDDVDSEDAATDDVDSGDAATGEGDDTAGDDSTTT